MSKKDKDKDKRKKGDPGKDDPDSAWIADLRRARPGEQGPMTHRSTSSAEDLSEDTVGDVAPIGPTEIAGATAAPDSVASRPAVEALRPPASMGQIEQQIRDLEARLDEMIGRGGAGVLASSQATPAPGPASAAAPVAADPDLAPATEASSGPWAVGATIPAPRGAPAAASDGSDDARATARELLPPDFYMRQWGRAARRRRAEEVDEFGHDPKYEARFLPLLDFLYTTYFRVEAEGTDNIPAEGRCLIVGNHSGGPLPYDGVMLRTTVRREHKEARELRWLAEDFVYYLPFVGTAMNRLGAVRACQENAERLLASGKLVAVFPEGAKGIGKLFRDRYQLQRFGRGGFIRLCLRTQTPIVPCAIVGAEEANPMLYRLEYMTKTLGIPYLPITPTFPALGPVGLLPAPIKWRVVFGEPMVFDAHGPEAADDDILVGRLSERVRGTIQSMLDRTLRQRKSIWFG